MGGPIQPWTVSTLSAGLDPVWVTYGAAGNLVYVLNYDSDNLTVLHDGAYYATVAVGTHPDFATYDGANGLLYVLNWGNLTVNSTVSVVRSTTVVATVPVGTGARTAVVDGRNGFVYVVNSASQNVSVLNGTSIVDTLGVGNEPLDVVYDPSNGLVYVTNLTDVFIFDGTTPVGSLTVGDRLDATLCDPANGFVYVASALTNEVAILNGTDLLTTVRVGLDPEAIVYSSDDRLVDVVDTNSGAVSVLQNETVLTNVSAGVQPAAAAYDAGNGFVYVVDPYSGFVSVLSGTSAVAEFLLGGGPSAVGYDPSDGRVYIADSTSNGVSVLNSTDLIALEEVGLPNLTPWGATIGNVTNRSAGDTVTFLESPGTYGYNLTRVPGFTANWSGRITEPGGSDVHALVGFRPFEYRITFVEQGLPVGTRWTVQVGSVVNSSTSNRTGVAEPNGTYPYTIAPLHGFTATWSGQLAVRGQPVIVNVTFRLALFPVTFFEIGLGAGTTWSIGIGSTGRSSNSITLEIDEPNGSYLYSITPIPGYSTTWSGRLSVTGGGVTETVPFTRLFYPVTFRETGLPAGTPWTVVAAGMTNRSASESIGFRLPNGSVPYTVLAVPGFLTDGSGKVEIQGTSVGVTVPFASFVWSVTIQEVGLAPSSDWTASLGATTGSSPGGAAIRFLVPNGTYALDFGPIPGFRTPATMSITVAGNPVNRTVVFAPASKSGTTGWSSTWFGVSVADWVGVALLGAVVGILIGIGSGLRRKHVRSLDPDARPDGDPRDPKEGAA
ncbi:MAG: YncE family protein [Thermoplasmata archaeon]|nr:YncE family protein [Thermoplasmata archaeon]MCI4359845.1 YncE family protein [Thermoplasmata archaeon]